MSIVPFECEHANEKLADGCLCDDDCYCKTVGACVLGFADSRYQSPPTIDPDPVYVKDLVQNDFDDRVEFGKVKYGVYLQVEDGRDPLVDAYTELWDLLFYMRKELYKRYGK